MTLESTIEDYLVKRIKEMGGKIVKADTPGTRFIDRICMLPGGVTIYAELKRPKNGRRSALQEHWIEWLRENGHAAGFAKTKDEVDSLLEAALKRRT